MLDFYLFRITQGYLVLHRSDKVALHPPVYKLWVWSGAGDMIPFSHRTELQKDTNSQDDKDNSRHTLHLSVLKSFHLSRRLKVEVFELLKRQV